MLARLQGDVLHDLSQEWDSGFVRWDDLSRRLRVNGAIETAIEGLLMAVSELPMISFCSDRMTASHPIAVILGPM